MIGSRNWLAADQQTSHEPRADRSYERLAWIFSDKLHTVIAPRTDLLACLIIGDSRLRFDFLADNSRPFPQILDCGARLRARIGRHFANLRLHLLQFSARLGMQFGEQDIEVSRRHAELFAQTGEQFVGFAFRESQIVVGELAVALLEQAFDRVPVIIECELFHAQEIATSDRCGRI